MMSQSQLIVDLYAKTCRCGRQKTPKNTFCRRCYYALPAEMRAALYRRLGQGYEEAYQAALDYLDGGRPAA